MSDAITEQVLKLTHATFEPSAKRYKINDPGKAKAFIERIVDLADTEVRQAVGADGKSATGGSTHRRWVRPRSTP